MVVIIILIAETRMGSNIWAPCLAILLSIFLFSGAMGAAPMKPVDVPFGRNYVPTWAFDHIKYYNGGSEIQLYLDKYTGKLYTYIYSQLVSYLYIYIYMYVSIL